MNETTFQADEKSKQSASGQKKEWVNPEIKEMTIEGGGTPVKESAFGNIS